MTTLPNRTQESHPFAACRPQLALAVLLLAGSMPFSASGQTLIYQEGFNSDGETNVPPRYTTTGRDVYEVSRIQSELVPNNSALWDQKGPIYWTHNFNVSYVGNPAIPARRMIFTWRTDPFGATTNLLQLFQSSVNWLLNGKTNATIVVHPSVAAINELAAQLTAAGHTVVDDDTGTYPNEQDVPGDLFIQGPDATASVSRFAMVPKPVIVMHAPNYDDMLVGSIGSVVTFDPGQVTIATPTHPAAGGQTGSFTGFNSPTQPFGLVGSFLPPGATTLATVTRVVLPAVNNLGDVDAMIAGTKQHEETAGSVTDIDFADGSFGNWFFDNPIPGGYTGNWGLRVRGQLSVATAGTYRFALGSDDGARLQIDVDRNGFTSADTVLEDPGPHGHSVVYNNVTFATAGDYDFEVRSYNSGGSGSLELSVSLVEAPVPDDALTSGFWEVLSLNGTGPIKLVNATNVTGYVATGPNVNVETPLIVLLNGPTDTPAGSFYDGGPFTGFEGTGFFAAAGLNKWPYPVQGVNYRTLQLRPVNVAGRSNVKLTIALAATVVDFEMDDILDIVVYTNGLSSNPTTNAHFRGVVNAIQPWLADEKENYTRRLTKQFADFTYDIPAGATDLVVEIRVATTWWTEIAAFDNIRITEGAAVRPALTATAGAGMLTISWTAAAAGFVLDSSPTLGTGATWSIVPGTPNPITGAGSVNVPTATGNRYYRLRQ